MSAEKRYYSLMKLEDYPPYAALGEKPVLYGPAPKYPINCGCGRYKLDNMCLCATSCMHMEKYKWAKENPDLYKKEQEGEKRWATIYNLWYKQKRQIDDQWHFKSKDIVREFDRLQDNESPIYCHECEQKGAPYCRCCCDYCASKWCDGECMNNDYDDYGGYEDNNDSICYCNTKGCNRDCGTLSCGCIDVCRGRCGRDIYTPYQR